MAALTIAKKLKDKQMMAHAYGNLAASLSQSGRYQEALPMHQEALRYFVELGDIAEQLPELERIANCLAVLTDYGACFQIYQQLQELSHSVANRSYEAKACSGMGYLARLHGLHPQALDFH